jgi:ribosomal protein S18 acetylase RimI-like enzyme
MTPAAPFTLRFELRPDDEQTVRDIVASTDFFSVAEQEIAVELVAERRAKGDESGYHFVFLDRGGETLGYACHGPIPATASSFDLYWIAVAAAAQRQGLGRHLLLAAERAIAALGGTRIYVDTSSRPSYTPTRAFYVDMGYRIEAQLESFYAPDDGKVVFCKVLTA